MSNLNTGHHYQQGDAAGAAITRCEALAARFATLGDARMRLPLRTRTQSQHEWNQAVR